ncbi:class C beta-lactamase [Duganella aceris]|uniref:Beta-lactamase n=1 Tax=Duganella aceris TaxID=2703883 RepID=A0ABX0FMV6_9BURK|nr:beta-lactamase [Duganella aceris]
MALAMLSCGLAPLAAHAADDAKLRAIVDQAIRPVMAEYNVPGIAVAVTVDGKASFFNYGLASKEDNTPVSETTLFELGSVTKTFVATLVSYAQVQGKLSLDDHPGKYVPQLKGSAIDKATLLNLGTYTAGGLPLQFPDDVSDDKAIDYFKQWKPDAAPGAQRRYSNPSLGLFGHVAGLALHSRFSDSMDNKIFPGLGMRHSYVHVPPGAMASYAMGYDEKNQPGRMSPDVFADETYGIKSSSADMIRYVQANIDPTRLEPTLRRAVDGTHVGYFRIGGMVQGLGWEQYPYPVSLQQLQAGNSRAMIWEANAAQQLTPPQTPSAPTWFNKTGSTNRFGAYVAFVPAQKIGIVILANKNYPIPDRIKAAHAILQQLAP